MNAIRANTRVLYENMLVELRNPAGIKVTDDEAHEYAVSAGARFIKLRYNGDVSVYTKGFQMGVLNIARGRDGVRLTWEAKTTESGKPDKMGRLFFKPDKLGILWGLVPVFEYNKRLLASCLMSGGVAWTIVDEKDRNEIEEYANKLGLKKQEVVVQPQQSFREAEKLVEKAEAKAAVPELKPDVKPKPVEIKGPVRRGRPPKSKMNIQRGEEVNREHISVGDVHKE